MNSPKQLPLSNRIASYRTGFNALTLNFQFSPEEFEYQTSFTQKYLEVNCFFDYVCLITPSTINLVFSKEIFNFLFLLDLCSFVSPKNIMFFSLIDKERINFLIRGQNYNQWRYKEYKEINFSKSEPLPDIYINGLVFGSSLNLKLANFQEPFTCNFK